MLYPYATVERVGHDIFLSKVLQVYVSQSRESTEKEQIADECPFEVHLRSVDKLSEFFFGKESFFCFLFRHTAVREWITYQLAVFYRPVQQHTDGTGIYPDRVAMQVFFCKQVSLKIGDECWLNFFQCNVTHMIA